MDFRKLKILQCMLSELCVIHRHLAIKHHLVPLFWSPAFHRHFRQPCFAVERMITPSCRRKTDSGKDAILLRGFQFILHLLCNNKKNEASIDYKIHKNNMKLCIYGILNIKKNAIFDALLYSQNLHDFALIMTLHWSVRCDVMHLTLLPGRLPELLSWSRKTILMFLTKKMP